MSPDRPPAFWPGVQKLPRIGTSAARDFWTSFEQANRFTAFVLKMASHIDTLHPALVNARMVLAETDQDRQAIRQNQAEWRGPLSELAAQRQFFLEVILVRQIENYLSYLSSLLFEIFKQRPEAMKSQDKVALEFVLDHKSMNSLIRGLAEKKVDALSYSSFDKLFEYFAEQFGVAICPEDQRDALREWIETRNISVHNRCRINRRYLERVPDSKRKLGSTRIIGIDVIEQMIPVLQVSVRHADASARRHLKLRGRRFNVRVSLDEAYDKAHEEFRARVPAVTDEP